MKTSTTKETEGKAQEQSEQLGTQKKWDLFIAEEPYGFVHATSEADALSQVARFNRPFRAVPAQI